MPTVRNFPPSNLGAHIQAAYPRHAIKRIARSLSCSDRQAWRIATTGKVPSVFRAALIELLDEQIAQNRAKLEALHADLKAIEHAEMVARAENRRAVDVGPSASLVARPAQGPTQT